MTHILRIDASARQQGSVSRGLTDRFMARFPDAKVTTRDLADSTMPFLDDAWVNGTFTPEDMRSDAQVHALAFSDTLVAEVQAADVIVIGSAVYNFGPPAALKAWIDQIARAGVTFQYGENGPEGLLTGKRAVIIMASGGTEIDSPADFLSPYLKFILGFMGITDVDVIGAVGVGGEEALDGAGLALDALTLVA